MPAAPAATRAAVTSATRRQTATALTRLSRREPTSFSTNCWASASTSWSSSARRATIFTSDDAIPLPNGAIPLVPGIEGTPPPAARPKRETPSLPCLMIYAPASRPRPGQVRHRSPMPAPLTCRDSGCAVLPGQPASDWLVGKDRQIRCLTVTTQSGASIRSHMRRLAFRPMWTARRSSPLSRLISATSSIRRRR